MSRYRAATATFPLLAALCAALAGPPAVCAQTPGSHAFVTVIGADTFAVENVTRSVGRLEGEITSLSMGRMVYVATLLQDGTVQRLDLQAWMPGADRDGAPMQHVRMTMRGDSIDMELTGAAGEQRRAIPTRSGATMYLNPSMALIEQLLIRGRGPEGATVDVPLFLLNGGQTIPATVARPAADSAVVVLGGATMHLAVDGEGRLLRAEVPAQRLTVTRVDGAHVTAIATEPPDYSAPEGAPYSAEDVVVPTPMGHVLAGTLTRPHTSAPVPAVVLITGSGSQDRDEAIPTVRGYRPFRDIADTLSRQGIAVLRLDDRGFGASTGDASTATSADYADDVRAALAWLRTREDIDGRRLGLIGHSEGGMIAPMVAATDTLLAGIVLIAGPSRTGRRIIEYQQQYAVEHAGTVAPEARDSVLAAARVQLDEVAARQPWMGFFLEYDPLPTARRVRTPVLILQGATDRQVTADQAGELAAAFREGGNADVAVVVFDDINHLMLRDSDGDPAGYSSLEDRRVAQEVLEALVDWVTDRLRR
ncbi:MAG TPA: alpha/beta fold hydrolase [Longimicrobiales bacterium]|nr:alpha/beta fold hydrolase [Longimicrobiales bacterium]